MPYIGRDLNRGNYLKLDDISSSFDSSTTTFNLTVGGSAFTPGSAFAILVSVGGVIQEPESAYQVNNSEITFANAPTAQDSFFCIALGVSLGIGVPGSGTVNGPQMAKPFNYDGFFYLDDANNRVGINSSAPKVALDVNGNAKISGILTAGSYSGPISNPSGISTFYDVRVTNNLTVEGSTTTLDTDLIGVDRVEVAANSNSIVGVAITQSGTADIINLFDGNTEVLTVIDGGKVGIGTANPTELIDVLSTSNNATIQVRTTGAGAWFEADSASSGYSGLKLSSGGTQRWLVGSFATNNFTIKDGGTSGDGRFTIVDGTGNIGIGTDAPDTQLEVFGGSTSIQVGNQSGSGRFGADGTSTKIGSHSNHHLDLFTNGVANTRLRIDSNGRVLINTTNNSNGHIAASNLAVQGGDFTIFKDSGGDNADVSGHKLKFVTQSGSIGEIDVLSEGGGGPAGRGGAMRFYTKANNTSSADEKLRITSDGYIKVSGDQGNSDYWGKIYNRSDGFSFHAADGSVARNITFYSGAATSTERFRITSGGNIGINRTNPDQRLNVNGNIEVNAYDSAGGSGGYYTAKGLIIGNAYDAGKTSTDDRNAIIWNERGLDLDIATNNTLAMKIKYDGKVGINTNNPETRLHVSDGYLSSTNAFDSNIVLAISKNTTSGSYAGLAINSGSGAKSFIHFGDTDDSNVGRMDYDHSTNSFTFYTNGQNLPRFFIGSSGKAGINDETPDATLSVGGATAFIDVGVAGGNRGKIGYSSNDLYFGTSSSSGEFIFKNNINSDDNPADSGTELVRITSDGQVGIGSEDPGTQLDIFKYTNTNASNTGTTLLRLTNHVGSTDSNGDILSPNGQKTFIDFRFMDGNSNFTPQVRIGAQVGQISGDSGEISEGFGSFVVHTGQGTDGSGGGVVTEKLRVTPNGYVGINTNNPDSPLHVHTSASESIIATFGSTDNSGGGATYQALLIRNNVTGYPAIENASSSDILDLRSSGSVQATIDSNNNDTGKFFRVVTNGTGSSGTELFIVQETGATKVCHNGGAFGVGGDPINKFGVTSSSNDFFGLHRSNATTGTGEFNINIEANSQVTFSMDDEGAFSFGTSTDPSAQSGYSEKFRIDANGNIKTGRTASAVDFTNSNGGDKFIEIGSNTGDALLVTHSSGYGVAYFGYEAGGDRVVIACDGGGGNNKIDFITDAGTSSGGSTDNLNGKVPKMRIDANGRVSINETTYTSQGQLTIKNTNDFNTASISGTTDNIYLISDSTSGDGVYGASIGFSRVEYPDRRAAAIVSIQEGSDEDVVGLSFFTHPGTDATSNVVEKFRINAEQGVKVFIRSGSNAPLSDVTGLLFHNGAGGGDIGSDSMPTHIDWAWQDSNPNGRPQCRISGNVGDGGDPNNLAKEGKGFLTFHCSDTNSETTQDLDPPQRLRIAHNGTFTGSSSNNISDQRLKENIATITDPIAKIKALKGRTFTWKSEASMREGTHYGFIAQEVESIIPDLIVDDTGIRVFDKDDNLQPSNVITPPVGGGYAKSVDADGVTPVLVEALKEALSKIEVLEAKVAALEGS